MIELFAKLAAEIDNITFWFVECGFLDRRFVVMQKVSKKFRLNNVQDKYVSLIYGLKIVFISLFTHSNDEFLLCCRYVTT